MGMEEALSKLMNDEEPTAVDVAMKLLDEKAALMTTEIKNVSVMNALKVYIAHYGDPHPENKSYSPKSALVMQTLYDANVLHMVGYKRQRANEIVKIFTGLQLFLGMGTQQDPNQKSGLFGKKR